MPHDPTLRGPTGKRRKAVEALLATGEVKAAAEQAGISRDTLHRWLRDPAFLAAVRKAEAEALDELSRLLVGLGRTAAETLAGAMQDPAAPWPTQVRAEDAVLPRLLHLGEMTHPEMRAQALDEVGTFAVVRHQQHLGVARHPGRG